MNPWTVLLVAMAGMLNREQQLAIDYLRTENAALREKLGGNRVLLTDQQRRRLAVRGKVLGRKLLREVVGIVSPETILRWHRELVARKWDYSHRRRKVGRPRVRPEIVELTVRMARENPSWGYDRIQGALANVGYRISDSTVANILKQHGIEPAPQRVKSGSWAMFLRSHWETIGAIDFTTVEVWTRGGLVTFYVLVAMRLKSREIVVAGVTASPDAAWVRQMARNLTCDEGFLAGSTHLLLDRDTKFVPLRRYLEEHTAVKPVLLPPRSPNLNAHLERQFRSMKSECLDRLIFFGERSLRRALRQWVTHYHAERNHQGLSNQLITPLGQGETSAGEVQRNERLGGLLRYYHRRAA
ncbi:MAG: integrase core domain-containing protein [Planctomycetaceae bacterium]|nr:integrase core domain-containing protein [Planctomycetaceae bacterium]